MDRKPEELKSLGLIGTAEKTTRTIFRMRKAMIVPLTILFLAHKQSSTLVLFNLYGLTRYSQFEQQMAYDSIYSDGNASRAFELLHFMSLLALSLFATSALLSTVALANTTKNITVVLAYNFFMAAFLLLELALNGLTTIGFALTFFPSAAYMMGLVYLVVEDLYGAKSMEKSRSMMSKGKTGATPPLMSLLLLSAYVGVELLLDKSSAIVAAGGLAPSLGLREQIGITCLLLGFKVVLFGIVVQALVSSVSRPCHHEKAGRRCCSAGHVEIDIDVCIPLKDKDALHV